MLQVERHNIKTTPEMIELCSIARELYNRCNYLMRKAWFGKQQLPDISVLNNATKHELFYRNCYNSKVAKQTIRQVLFDWTNFKLAVNAYKKNPSKFTKRPKPPGYKDKLSCLIFNRETISKKAWTRRQRIEPTKPGLFSLESKHYDDFVQVVLRPKSWGFVVEVQYEVKEEKADVDKKKVCCIDLGLNNLCTITSDQHKPILVNGRPLKSINQWYNKQPRARRSVKRYWRIENYMHHVSKLIIDNCIKHGLGTIIVGKNTGWKRGINLGRKTNQSFSFLPIESLLQKISYKAKLVGIQVMLTEEAYTSQASFVDRDPIPVYEARSCEARV